MKDFQSKALEGWGTEQFVCLWIFWNERNFDFNQIFKSGFYLKIEPNSDFWKQLISNIWQANI